MDWLQGNWLWILFIVAMFAMHMFGHGGHGHSGHHGGGGHRDRRPHAHEGQDDNCSSAPGAEGGQRSGSEAGSRRQG